MIFLGNIYQKKDENDILKSSYVGLSNADNMLQYNIIEGMDENLSTPLNLINVPNIGSYPKKQKKLYLRTERWSHNNISENLEIGMLNFPIIKHIIIYKKLKKTLKQKVKSGEKVKNIVIYSTYLPFLKAVYGLDSNIKITLIVPDLPGFYHQMKINNLKRSLLKIYDENIYKYLSRINKFVLLTEAMKEPLRVDGRPYVVIEGMVNNCTNDINSLVSLDKEHSDKKIIMYSGGLHYDYGIKQLIEAFKLIQDKNYELWICGLGEAEEEIIELSRIDTRITYYGYLPQEEVFELQNKATVLINPRTPDEEYTKYSFPSKIMEYMLSGKPVIMYKLPCIPKEYDDYLIYIDGNTPANIYSTLVYVCEKSEQERKQIGDKSRCFVKNNKNKIVQTQKIIDLLNS